MISANAKYWIWITQALGYNNNKVKGLFDLYSDISEFYNGGEPEWKFCGIFSVNEIEHLKKTPIEVSDRILSDCSRFGYSVLCIDDANYPECLLNIYAPPAVLYINGTLPEVDDILTIGIVGTRTASDYGLKNSYKIGYSLAKFGVCTVSGGALGVDCAAHRGTLAADGMTICVLGCGINYNYLRENEGMRKAITNRGAVISEYPPDTPPKSYHFPQRNRIIAALSNGVLIIESGAKSGSLITANLALDMGKELFALLGNNSPQNEGSNQRIKEGTAIPITDFMDILVAFKNQYNLEVENPIDDISLADIEQIPAKGKSIAKNRQKISKNAVSEKSDILQKIPQKSEQSEKPKHRTDLNLTGDAKIVYEYLTAEPVHIDKISNDLGIPVFRVLSALTQLEMKNLASSAQGRKFSLR